MSESVKDKKIHKVGTPLLVKLILLTILLIIIAVGIPFTRFYITQWQAREVLTEAKTARLAAQSIAYEYYAKAMVIGNQSEPYGFAPGVEESIKELAQCDGDLYLLRFDAATYHMSRLMYVKDDFSAIYTNEEDAGQWKVYYRQLMVNP